MHIHGSYFNYTEMYTFSIQLCSQIKCVLNEKEDYGSYTIKEDLCKVISLDVFFSDAQIIQSLQ